MKPTRMTVTVGLAIVQVRAAQLSAEQSTEVEQLRRQIEELDQKLRVLERKRDLEANGETAKTAPVVSLDAGGLQIRSADSNFVFRARGYVQVDAQFYPTPLLPNRDGGFGLQGDLFRGGLSYAAGVFNGVSDGGSSDFDTTDSDRDAAARLFAHPLEGSHSDALKGLGLGVAGTYGNREGPLRSYASLGARRIFSYRSGAGTNAATANVQGDGFQWRLTWGSWTSTMMHSR